MWPYFPQDHLLILRVIFLFSVIFLQYPESQLVLCLLRELDSSQDEDVKLLCIIYAVLVDLIGNIICVGKG